jgi:TP901 family phage tail tape measure protein
MAERLAYLEAVIGADITAFRRGTSEVRKDLNILSESVGGLQRVGRNATLALTVPTVALGTFAVQTASDFDASLRNINSIAQLSEQEFANLTSRVREFGLNTRGGLVETADSLYEVYSAGASGEQAFELMQHSVLTAEAGLADLQTTTKALTQTLLAYSAYGYDAAYVSDVLTRTVQVGVGEMGEFASSMGRVAPLAAALGIELHGLGGSWAFMTQRGASAGTAATEMYGVMSKLLKPTEALSEAFDELGVETGQELIDKFGGFQGAVLALYEAFDKSETAMAAAFGNERAIRGLLKLVNDVPAWNAAMEEFNTNLEDATESAWAKQMESFAASVDLLKTATEGASEAIGSALIPVLQPLVDKATTAIKWFAELPPEIIRVTVGVTALAAALPPLIWLFGGVLTPLVAATTAFNPLGAAIAGILTPGKGLLAILSPIRMGLMGIVSLGANLLVAGSAFAALALMFSTSWTDIKQVIDAMVAQLDNPFRELNNLYQQAKDILFPPEEQSLVEFAREKLNGEDTLTVDAGDVFTIEAGDTFWDIWADNYSMDITWDEFKEANDVSELLIPGDDIVVFTGQEQVTQAFEDSVSAALYGASTADMVGDNLLPPGFEDEVDQRLAGELSSTFEQSVTTILFPEDENSLAEETDSFWDRVKIALGAIGPKLRNYLLFELTPQISSAAGTGLALTGVILTNKIESALDWIANADAPSKDEIKTYLNTYVIAPFADAFMEEFEGSRFQEVMTTIGDKFNVFMDAVRGVVDFVVPDGMGETWGEIGDNLVTFGEGVGALPWAKIGLILGTITLGVGRLATVLGTEMALWASERLADIGGAIENFVDFVEAASVGDVSAMFDALAVGVVDLALGIAGITVAPLDRLIERMNTIFDWDLPTFRETLLAWRDDLTGEIGEYEEGSYSEITVPFNPDVEIDWEDAIGFDPVAAGIIIEDEVNSGLDGLVLEGVNPYAVSVPIEVSPMSSVSDSNTDAFMNWNEPWSVPEAIVTPDLLTVNFTGTEFQTSLGEGEELPQIMSDELQEQVAAAEVSGMSTAISAYIEENPEEGAEGFINDFFMPIEEAWLQTFGPESEAILAYKGFLTEVATTSEGIDTSLTEMKDNSVSAIDTLVAMVRPQMMSLETTFQTAQTKVQSFIDSMMQLANMDARIKADVRVEGSVSLNGMAFGGGRASGGNVSGGMGYMVGENGPEMFYPGQNGTIVSNRDSYGGGDTYIVIEGVKANAQELIEDLELEGVYLRG